MEAQREELLDRVTRVPGVCGGRPIIRGTRWSIEAMLTRLAGGESWDYLLAEFPELTKEDWLAAIAFAAASVSEHELRKAA